MTETISPLLHHKIRAGAKLNRCDLLIVLVGTEAWGPHLTSQGNRVPSGVMKYGVLPANHATEYPWLRHLRPTEMSLGVLGNSAANTRSSMPGTLDVTACVEQILLFAVVIPNGSRRDTRSQFFEAATPAGTAS